jgi:beta-glucosidase/6-phospho-beta-glucosidase/beta-galactosidase
MAATIDGTTGLTSPAGGVVNPSTTLDGINYSTRAWVNFNGTGTVAIRASGNVSSITDNGTGDYTVNFTTAMTDANYAGVAIGSYTYSVIAILTAPTTSAFRFSLKNPNSADGDSTYVMVAVFR